MSGLAGRLRRLEGGGSPCPECGHTPGARVRFVFGEGPYEGPKPCPTCGRPRAFTLDISAASARPGPEGEADEGGGGGR